MAAAGASTVTLLDMRDLENCDLGLVCDIFLAKWRAAGSPKLAVLPEAALPAGRAAWGKGTKDKGGASAADNFSFAGTAEGSLKSEPFLGLPLEMQGKASLGLLEGLFLQMSEELQRLFISAQGTDGVWRVEVPLDHALLQHYLTTLERFDAGIKARCAEAGICVPAVEARIAHISAKIIPNEPLDISILEAMRGTPHMKPTLEMVEDQEMTQLSYSLHTSFPPAGSPLISLMRLSQNYHPSTFCTQGGKFWCWHGPCTTGKGACRVGHPCTGKGG